MEDRNNSEYINAVNKFFETVEDEYLRKHQIMAVRYFIDYTIRGLLILHKMGYGKSNIACAIYTELGLDCIFISSKTLHINFREAIEKYTKATGRQPTSDIKYVALNASNMMDQVDKATLSELEEIVHKKTKMRGSLDNKLIIIDEAHNFFNSITNGSGNATKLYKAIMKSNCRLLFLSGSPIVNNPFEIALCFNMLSANKQFLLFPETYREFDEYFLTKESIKNAGKFANRINGLVSYFDSGAQSAKAGDMPEELPIITKKIVMSKFQYLYYFQARKIELANQLRKKTFKEKPLQKIKPPNASYRVRSRQISNFCFPEYAMRKYTNDKGQIIFENQPEKLDIKDIQKNIKTYSPKIADICEVADKHEGKGIIYSQFIEAGLRIIAYILESHGYTAYNEETSDFSSSKSGGGGGKKYIVISGEIDKVEVEKMLAVFNSAENKDGNLIKIALISSTGAEGIDFNNLRFGIITEPYWAWSRLAQIIGRLGRMGSHKDLPPAKRNYQIYIYLSVHGIKNNAEPTTEEYLMQKSINNQKLINSFYTVMRMSAIDCPTHYKDCRKCEASSKKLFAEDLKYDMTMPDICETEKKTDAKIFKYKGATYAEYDENGARQFARLNTETGKYEKVTEEERLELLISLK